MTREHTAVRVGDILTLSIEKLVHGGLGFSHYGTRACFVANAIPGETAAVRIERVHAHYLSGTAVDVISASLYRVQPRCSFVVVCGGCHWQHISYEHQLFWKAHIVRESIARIAGIRDSDVPLPLPCPEPFHYRTRAVMQVSGQEIGYFKEKTHELVPVADCPVLALPLSRAIGVCRRTLHDTPAFAQALKRLHILLIRHTGAVLVLAGRSPKGSGKYILLEDSLELAPFDGDAHEDVEGLLFKRDTENFYQINDQQNRALIRLVIEYSAPVPGDEILELYCGSGNFSLFLGSAGASVIGVESNASAVAEARDNAAMNGITSCRFVCSDVARLDPSFFRKRYRAVLINPPRTGCPQHVLAQIGDARPERIVYVSCNPSTLGRDIKELCSRGYKLERIQPVDLFPQTWHVETVVRLGRV